MIKFIFVSIHYESSVLQDNKVYRLSVKSMNLQLDTSILFFGVEAHRIIG